MPIRPLSLFRMSVICWVLNFRLSAKNEKMLGSTSPERVPITKPSKGVRPMLVSMDLPLRTAVMEAPLPKWAMTSFRLFLSAPKTLAASSATKR